MFTETLQSLMDWMRLNPDWAGLIVFSLAMAESLAIVGVLVPGVAILFGFGALIGAGVLEFWPMVSWAVAGAIVGDGLSFLLGWHFHHHIREWGFFQRHLQGLEQAEAFFEKYGGKSIFFGRFFGPIRAVIPLAAGMMGMNPWRFVAANVASALVWAPAYLLPGMVFGASLDLAGAVAWRLLVVLALIGGLIWGLWLLYRYVHPRHAMAGRGLLWVYVIIAVVGLQSALKPPAVYPLNTNIQAHWQASPTPHWSQALLWLSPEINIQTLPVGLIGKHNHWVEVLGEQQRRVITRRGEEFVAYEEKAVSLLGLVWITQAQERLQP